MDINLHYKRLYRRLIAFFGFDTLFIDTISNPYTVFGQSLFIVLTILVVAKG